MRLFTGILLWATLSVNGPPKLPAAPLPTAAALTASLPLSFEPNRGQTGKSVQFLSRGAGYTLFLTKTDAVLKLGAATVRMQVAGGNPKAAIDATEPLPGVSNYFVGSDPAAWRPNVPHYGRSAIARFTPASI